MATSNCTADFHAHQLATGRSYCADCGLPLDNSPSAVQRRRRIASAFTEDHRRRH